jgi:hypothetical protein
MVVNKLQNGVLNSRKTQSASRLNCQNIFFQIRTVTPHFETNDEHEKLSKFIALQYNKLTKLS